MSEPASTAAASATSVDKEVQEAAGRVTILVEASCFTIALVVEFAVQAKPN